MDRMIYVLLKVVSMTIDKMLYGEIKIFLFKKKKRKKERAKNINPDKSIYIVTKDSDSVNRLIFFYVSMAQVFL